MAETKKPDAIGDAGAYTNFVSNIGTERDKASHGSFVKKVIPDEQLEAVYQHWLAKRIVNRPASDMLRAGWFFEGIQDNDLLKLKEACKAFNLDGVLLSSLVLSRLYGVCYVLLGTVDGGNLDQPFDLNKLGVGRLEFFTVLKKKYIEADTSKYLSPKEAGGLLKQPEFYKLKLDGKSTQRIHHTRLYKFGHADVVNEEPVSVLQEVYEDLLDHAAVKKASASLVHESKIDVIRTPGLVDKIKADLQAVAERFLSVGLLKGLNGMIVLDAEEEYDSKSYSFGGLPDLMREFSIQAAGAADMPYTILFGQSPAGMNATGEHDTRNYYDSIATKQIWSLKPFMMKLLKVIVQTTFGRQFPSLDIVFNPLWQLDAKVRSEVEKANAERDAKYLEMGIITEPQIARQLLIDGVYSVIDEEHIKGLETMVKLNDNDNSDPETTPPAGEET
ncbi:DUF1073 domain-containing protein [Acinetobacter baumannii]|uniref:DUF1073 domain-containing protein n=1 Tax=Acinetobacter baumannii TaxID=470 RepID=UPI00050D70BE|nr:DUF1073 domain-containing protein [Acinetobacter baumannii]EKT8486617.1 DUF1073 domain-containing protein [Acinetobacter baumannii]EKV0059264.1 DUF1073 domain-containing protein [Acinetobacter baumannii]EKY0041076.1 DUF1073 domain-containing protein [Acinetobacter baumannii]EKY0959981.1 DUF1073 domain-containing protein [Acinetobacter baumannii]MBE2841747.1 DUF1073 domain-containing protein [Acinetobacter baumannii]